MNVNKQILLGRVGKDVEFKTTETGTKLAKFSLATTEKYTNKQGEKVQETQWHNILIWGNLADIANKYVNKGDLLYVEGKTINRSYESNGETKYITEVVVQEMNMLSSKKKQEAESDWMS